VSPGKTASGAESYSLGSGPRDAPRWGLAKGGTSRSATNDRIVWHFRRIPYIISSDGSLFGKANYGILFCGSGWDWVLGRGADHPRNRRVLVRQQVVLLPETSPGLHAPRNPTAVAYVQPAAGVLHLRKMTALTKRACSSRGNSAKEETGWKTWP
jgi:hypothetical protein